MEIKKCPFCGSNPITFLDLNFSDKYVVQCEDCGIEKRAEYDMRDAIWHWNNRHGEGQGKMSNVQFLLTKLAEECDEVGQMAAKCQQFGLDEVYSGDGNVLTNKERLHGELNDLLGVIDMLNTEEGFNFNTDWAAKVAKQEKIARYREYSVDLGFVEVRNVRY